MFPIAISVSNFVDPLKYWWHVTNTCSPLKWWCSMSFGMSACAVCKQQYDSRNSSQCIKHSALGRYWCVCLNVLFFVFAPRFEVFLTFGLHQRARNESADIWILYEKSMNSLIWFVWLVLYVYYFIGTLHFIREHECFFRLHSFVRSFVLVLLVRWWIWCACCCKL